MFWNRPGEVCPCRVSCTLHPVPPGLSDMSKMEGDFQGWCWLLPSLPETPVKWACQTHSRSQRRAAGAGEVRRAMAAPRQGRHCCGDMFCWRRYCPGLYLVPSWYSQDMRTCKFGGQLLSYPKGRANITSIVAPLRQESLTLRGLEWRMKGWATDAVSAFSPCDVNSHHKIHSFKVYSLVVFSIFWVVGPSTQSNSRTFSSPQEKTSCPLASFPIPSSSPWQLFCLYGFVYFVYYGHFK